MTFYHTASEMNGYESNHLKISFFVLFVTIDDKCPTLTNSVSVRPADPEQEILNLSSNKVKIIFYISKCKLPVRKRSK